MSPRPHHPDAPPSGNPPPPQPTRNPNPRLNLLLSRGDRRRSEALEQIPPLLAPLGIHSIIAHSGDEAAGLIRQIPIHIAVIDFETPLHSSAPRASHDPHAPHDSLSSAASTAGGSRILQLLRRLEQPPPTVVIRPPQPTTRESQRTLCEALREGAFAVLDQPLQREVMLEVMRRILRRYYANRWPGGLPQ